MGTVAGSPVANRLPSSSRDGPETMRRLPMRESLVSLGRRRTKWWWIAATVATLQAWACSPVTSNAVDGGGGVPDAKVGTVDAGPPVIAKRSSKSSTIAITDDDTLVVMVNPDDGSISIFQTSDNTRI